MESISQKVSQAKSEILESWRAEAQQASSAQGLSSGELMSVVAAYLDSLAESGAESGSRRRVLLEKHVTTRIRQGFEVSEIVDEVALLGHCTSLGWSAPETQPP